MALKQIFVTSLDADDATAKDTLGDIREENGKRYKYVKFTSAIDAGDVVKYADSAGYLANEVLENAISQLVCAGVAVATHAINRFGWIQTRGQVTLAQAVNSGAIATGVMGHTTAGMFTVVTGVRSSYGTMLNATTSCLLHCPD